MLNDVLAKTNENHIFPASQGITNTLAVMFSLERDARVFNLPDYLGGIF